MTKPGLAIFNHQLYSPQFCRELLMLGVIQTRPHLSMVVAILALLFGNSELLPQQTKIIWLVSALTAMLIGFAFKGYYQRRQALTDAEVKRAEWVGLFYSASVGLLWGSSSQLLLPQELGHNLIICMIYLGVCAGASTIAIFGLGHLLAGSLVGAGLFLGRFPVVFPEHWLSLVVLFIIYHAVILRMAWERNQIIIANMRLRADKEELLGQRENEVARAKQANQEKSAFLAAASHDLRQPVHALMLLGHALRLRLPAGENAGLVERMLEAGQALADQFNHLMDLTRLESGVYKLNLAPVVLGEFIHRTCAAHRQLAAQQHISLRVKIDKRLLNKTFSTDSGLLTRILDNLLANAIKFSPAASRILVTVRLTKRGKGLRLGVYDQGVGIPADQQQQVFKPYVQLHNPARDRAKGIGLGLSIVHEAAALLNAGIQLQSVDGRGSHFEIVLPDVVWCEVEPAPAKAMSVSVPVSSRLQGRRLLLVEDDPMSAQALATWAQNWGLLVEHHLHPETVPATANPDLILCDIRLPGTRDGIDCLSDWLVDWPQARGLLVSGELLAETHERAEQEGLMLLSKPVDPDLLLQTLAGLLR